MSYTEDAVKAKLSSLNETQESIVTVAQWIMFHRRYAERTAQLWFQRLKDSASPKRLNLVYLANEVVQQSKIRKKDDFLLAFSPIIVEATGVAAKGATNDVQQKLRRVVEVWRQRQIFDQRVQDEVEARIDDIDKSQSRGAPKKPLLGGSLFSDSSSSTAPTELQPLIPLQHSLSRASLAAAPATAKAATEYAALTDGSQPIPTPPVHAARLSALIKSLANAEDAVAESLKTRRALITALESLLETNKAELAVESAQHAELGARKEAMTTRRHEVEDDIMRGLSSTSSSSVAAAILPDNESNTAAGGAALNSNHSLLAADAEPARPEVERFTPPPAAESTTPPGLPASHSTDGAVEDEYERPEYEELTPPPPTSVAPALAPAVVVEVPGLSADPRRQLKAVHPRPGSGSGGSNPGSPVNGGFAPSVKRRRVSGHGGGLMGEEEVLGGGDAMEGLDAEVVGMLG